MVYLDTSAIVKLIRLERHTRALIAHLRATDDFVTSVVSTVEVHRAVHRMRGSARVQLRAGRVLDRFSFVELDASIRAVAAELRPDTSRALDAIHIASALDLSGDVSAFVTYDERQADAARSAGATVVSPGA